MNQTFKVECKKAQPKEVMLPANLAKGRTAARGLGELVMVSPGTGVLQALRYSPYSVPSTNTAMVALSQPLSFNSPSPSPLVSMAGTGGSGLHNPVSHLQLFGLDNGGQQYTLNQLLAGQLSLGCKTGSFNFQTGFEPPAQSGLNQFELNHCVQTSFGYKFSLNPVHVAM